MTLKRTIYIAFFLFFFALDRRAEAGGVLRSPWLRFVGVVSFEWFLLHQPAMMQMREWIGGTRGSLPLYAVAVGVPLVGTFLAAVAMYRWFSFPILQRGRRSPSTSQPKPS